MRRGSTVRSILGLALSATLGGSVAAHASDPVFTAHGSTVRELLPEPTRAKRTGPIDLAFTVPNAVLDQILLSSADVLLACSFRAGRSGVKVKIRGVLVDPEGARVRVPARTQKTGADGSALVIYPIPVTVPAGAPISLEMRLIPRGNKEIHLYSGSCGLVAQKR